MQRRINNIDEIVNELYFWSLDQEIISSKIFGNIAVEVYNCQQEISPVNDIIAFLSEIIPFYWSLYGKNSVETLEILAKGRNCNYINWFNEPNIPKCNIHVFQNAEDFFSKYPEKKYICPSCGWESTDAYKCSCTGCDWKVYWLLWDLGKGVHILFLDKINETPIPQNIFRPINFKLWTL